MNRLFSSRPVRRLLTALVLVAALCGCISQPRTPYNEYGAFSDGPEPEPGSTVNLWPLYNSDGRSHYVAWPLIKRSPGCFAFLPFYNYDHGIHDVALLATLVPAKGEYRVIPFFYRNAWGYGSPLLFNVNNRFTHVLNTVVWSDGGCVFPFAWWDKEGEKLIWTAPMGLLGGVYRDREAGPDRVHWLFPLLYARTGGTDGSLTMVATPLAGGGKDSTDRWGYLFPLGFMVSGENCSSLYTLVGRRLSDASGYALNIGPLGMPIPYRHSNLNGTVTDALLPFWFARVYPGNGGGYLLTPFFGFGKNAEEKGAWWYGLVAGHLKDRKGTVHWALPLWLVAERNGKSTLWTPLFTRLRDADGDRALNVGPLGLPWPYTGKRAAYEDSDIVFPLFSRKTRWYVDKRSDGTVGRTGVRSRDDTGLLSLLWSSSIWNHAPDADLTRGFHMEGWEWSLGFDLLGATDRTVTTRYSASDAEDAERIPWITRTQRKRFGWLLWRSSHVEDSRYGITDSLFTPLYSHETDSGPMPSSETGLLMDAVSWYDRGGENPRFGLDVLWSLGARYGSTEDASDLEILAGLLWNGYTDPTQTWRLRRIGPWEAFGSDGEAMASHNALFGLLWHSALYGSPKTDTRPAIPNHRVRALLCGLLYWNTAVGLNDPGDGPRSWYQEYTSVLTPLVWSSVNDRQSTLRRRVLCGLLHDYDRDIDTGVETFGILGFLYRSVRTPEGSVDRSFFPFVTVGDDAKGTSYFSFFHRLIRVETTPEGRHVWLFWFKVS